MEKVSFKVTVEIEIRVGKEDVRLYAEFKYELVLQFDPKFGHELRKSGWSCRPLERVIWDDDDQTFYATAETTFVDTEGVADLMRRKFEKQGWRRKSLSVSKSRHLT